MVRPTPERQHGELAECPENIALAPIRRYLASLASSHLGRRLHEVPVLVTVPVESLLRVPSTPESTAAPGQVRLLLVAEGDDGRRTALRQELITLGAGGVEPQQGRYHFVVRMPLDEGRQTLVVGVRDEVAQRESIVSAELVVPVVGAAP